MFEKPLGLRENPFLAGHNPKYVFPSREHQEALAHLRYGIQNREPFVLITGEVGTGKTTAIYDALAEWGSRARVALITNSALTRSELLEEICLRFGVTIPSPVSKPQALVELQRQLTTVRSQGELALLLVDEAQNLDRELLEEIRLLSNLEMNGEYLLQIFLVGQPELENKLGQRELRQLRQRIGIHYRILPLSATETAGYIHHRVSIAGGHAEQLFPPETCVEIFRITNGIPREINIVAGQSLLNAFVEDGRSVTIEHVRGVEREIEFQSVLRDEAGKARTTKPRAAAAAPRRRTRPKTASPASPAATIIPIHPPGPAAGSAPPTRKAAPDPAPVAAGAEGESDLDVEVTEARFAPRAPRAEERPVEERAVRDRRRPAGEPATREPARTAPPGEDRPPPEEVMLPAWIEEIVAKRRAMDEQAAQPQTPRVASTPAPPPPVTPRPEAGEGRKTADQPQGPASVTLPPARIAPGPAAPISLFEPPARAHGGPPPDPHEGPEDDSDVPPPRSGPIGWPIASVLIAALGMTVLLLVRFGPWSGQRRPVAVVGTAPGAAADSAPASFEPFPPLEGPGLKNRADVPARRQPDAASRDRAAGAPPGVRAAGGAEPDAGGSVGAGAGGSGLPASSGAGADPDAGGSPGGALQIMSETAPSYAIAVGTYINVSRANAERARLDESTRLASRLLTVTEDTVSMYRVVVGNFGDRGSAMRAASQLVQLGLVTEARVIEVATPPEAGGP